MKISSGIAALAGVLILVCAAVAWEWYSHVSGRAPHTVQQVVADSTPAPGVKPSPSPSATPLMYVTKKTPAPVQASPQAESSAPPSPQATSAATTAPYTASTTVAQTAIPVEEATLAPHVVAVKPIAVPADAPPQILAMSISTPVAHGGDVVSGTVETSSNVASVEARIAGYSSQMQKIGTGKFALSYRVPKLPFFLHKTYMIQVIARNTKGQAVSTAVPITIR